MGNTVQTYTPKNQVITFGGIRLTGWISVKVVANSPTWNKEVGADGEIARGQSMDDTHKVTLELMQTSASGTYLNAIRVADKLTGLGGILPLNIADLSGVSRFFWLQAWITKMPDWERAKELKSLSVEFETGQSALDLIGGSI